MTDQIRLERSTPEAHGIASTAILDFVDAIERDGHQVHSFMLLRHGRVLAEAWWAPYAAELPHLLFSLSKSFTASAVGLAIAEGRLSLDDPVVGFFPEDLPAEVGPNLAAMRVRHLLAMSTGHADDTTAALVAAPDGNWVRAFLAQPVEYAPGSHFLYNTGATYMLSAILHRLTGEPLLDYLRPRLLDPLGIGPAHWQTDPRGIAVGGFGLSVTSEAVARFGQLYLQRGLWNGRRLLSEEWIAAASACQTPNGDAPESDWTQGYGYQFWLCRHGAYRADGAFGQFCVIMPEQDAVVVMTGGVDDMQAQLNLVWEHLLPALGPAPLPDDPAAQRRLRERLGGLALPLAAQAPSSPLAAALAGRTYRFAPNPLQAESLRLSFDGEGGEFVLLDPRGEHRIAAGHGALRFGVTTLDPQGPLKVAASGGWIADDTYQIISYAYETPFRLTLTLRFAGDRVTLDQRLNVSFGPLVLPKLTGHLESAGA